MPKRKYYKRRRKGVTRAQVQKMINSNIETKFHTNSWSSSGIQDVGRTPIDADLNNVAVGTGAANREGHQISLTGLYGKFVVTGADATNIVRVILYIPKDPTSSLSSVGGIGISTLIDQDRFTVMYDKYFTTTSNGPNQKVFTIARKWNKGSRKGIQTQFYGGASTDFAKNRLKLYVVGDSGAVSDPSLTGNIRCYFKDA